MSEKDILTKKSLDIEDNLAKTEENFIASYGKHEQKPLQILLSLYKGHYLQLILSGIFFALKHACVWYLPVATAGVINIASGYDDAGLSGIIFYISIEIGLYLLMCPPTTCMCISEALPYEIWKQDFAEHLSGSSSSYLSPTTRKCSPDACNPRL